MESCYPLCFESISPCDQKTWCVEERSDVGTKLTRLKMLNVKLGAKRVCIHHVLGAGFVAANQVLNVVDGVILDPILDPGAAPPEQPVYWSFSVLLALEVNEHLSRCCWVLQWWWLYRVDVRG